MMAYPALLGAADLPRRHLSAAVTLELPPVVRLEPVTAAELLGGGPDQAVAVRELASGTPPVNTIIVRELPALWQATTSLPLTGSGSLQATCEVVSEQGTANRLSLAGHAGAEIPVMIVSSPVLAATALDASVHHQGGITLRLDVGRVRYAGTYTGRLTVTLVSR
jgi:hypothetical protein